MRIALFHPSLIPPKDYGGVERVVYWLILGLREAGHEVVLAAFPGSKPPLGAKLVEMDPERSSAVLFAEKLKESVDVIHFHAPPEKEAWARMPAPGLVTVHGNGKPGEVFPRNTLFLSRDHARRHGATEFVYNGLDPSEYVFDPRSVRENYLFLSKTSWKVKNVKGAIRLCRKAGVGLDIYGGNRPYLERMKTWFNPRLNWRGPVFGQTKAMALAKARALVFPVLWDEPFGLAVVEALISGAPVLASARGSLPELLTPEVGMLLGGEEDRWINALREGFPSDIHERCRDYAISRFHYQAMTENYLSYYRRVINHEALHEKEPRTQEVNR